ncbi:MAG: transposase [Flavobacteriia bacterium]|nr:transposase [Flavobacteriia bacterium]
MKQGEKQNIKTNSAYYITLTVVNWIDIFTRKNHINAIIDSLKYCQKERGLVIFAYCIMTNHLHMIANTNEPFLLKDTIRDFKKFTAKKIISQILHEPESRREWMMEQFSKAAQKSDKHKNYMFWQSGNHAIELYSHQFVWDKINYIHQNPIRATYVKEDYHWVYSSATNYQDMDSVLEVEKIVHKLITYN